MFGKQEACHGGKIRSVKLFKLISGIHLPGQGSFKFRTSLFLFNKGFCPGYVFIEFFQSLSCRSQLFYPGLSFKQADPAQYGFMLFVKGMNLQLIFPYPEIHGSIFIIFQCIPESRKLIRYPSGFSKTAGFCSQFFIQSPDPFIRFADSLLSIINPVFLIGYFPDSIPSFPFGS